MNCSVKKNIKISEEVHKKIKIYAVKNGITLERMIKVLVENYEHSNERK